MSFSALKKILPHRSPVIKSEDLEGFKTVQRLAYEAVETVGKELRPGWSEIQAANLVGTYLKDHGVKAFFHEPFAWFSYRSRFDGINRKIPSDFNPTKRILDEDDVVILDVAPILEGYIGDIGYTFCLKPHAELKKAQTLLKKLRLEIPKLFDRYREDGSKIWSIVDKKIEKAGFDNIHQIYPFEVLGHRVEKVPLSNFSLRTPLRFSFHSFYQVLGGGLYPQLLHRKHSGDMTGFWAIEPHIGGEGFGAKFEEILVVDPDVGAFWLDDSVPHNK